MTVRNIPLLDWRWQFHGLKQYLDERGGVVQILVSKGSPAANFSKALRVRMATEEGNLPWKSVQFDSLNSNTHYLDDVVAQLDRSLDLSAAKVPHGEGGAVQIGTHNVAGSVEVSNVTVSHQEDDYAQTRRALARLDRVGDAIRARLETERIALLFLNSHTYDRDTRLRLRKMLWDEQLRDLTELGLLLIDFSDPSENCPEWPPEPDLQLDLPERFDQVSKSHAREDLVKFALEGGFAVDRGQADVFATTLLGSSLSIRDLYSRLSLLVADSGG